MAEPNNPTPPARFTFRRSSPMTRIALIAAIVLFIAALLALGSRIIYTRTQAELLRSQAAALEQENSQLAEDIEDMGSVDGIMRIAQEALGLVDPDTIIFTPEQ